MMDKYERTKKYLGQLQFLNRAIKNRTRDIQQIRETLTNISIELKGDRIQSSGSKDKLGDSIAKLVDLERETGELIEQYAAKKHTINTQLESMSKPDYYTVLYMKYCDGMKLYEIGDELHYSEVTVKRIHLKALKEFDSRFHTTFKS